MHDRNARMSPIRSLATLALGAAVLGMGGCSDLGNTGPEVRLFIQDSGDAVRSITAPVGFEGDIHMHFYAQIQDDVGFWNDMMSSRADIILPLGDEEGRMEVARRIFAAGPYTRVRLIISHFEVHLTDAPATFDMPPDGILRVEASQAEPFTPSRGVSLFLPQDADVVDLIVDLNSGDWIVLGEGGMLERAEVSLSMRVRTD